MLLLGVAPGWSQLAPPLESWAFEPGAYTFSPEAGFDLRSLNETTAGSKGWIVADEERFIHSTTGEEIRFWTVNTGVPATLADARTMTRFMAKMGVNMVRFHSSVHNNNARSYEEFRQPRAEVVANAKRLVAAAREAGIYTDLSHFFVLNLRIHPSWGIDGYDQAWMDANPVYSDRAPFGLVFFNDKMKNAYKNWVAELMTTPNPDHPNQTPLAQDRSVAIFEIQNEDNLFFNTFTLERFPEVVQNHIRKQFGDYLAAQYGSVQAAFDAWGIGPNPHSSLRGDDIAAGRVGVGDAYSMGGGGPGGIAEWDRLSGTNLGLRLRMADQIKFLAKVQYDFHAEIRDYVRAMGYGGTFIATNWKTSDERFLHDVEIWTYTAADVIDTHNYFGVTRGSRAVSNQVSGGDTYYDSVAINNPRRSPTVYKHVRGHPTFLSESTWVNPNDAKAEGAPLTAAYLALSGQGGFTWFSSPGSANPMANGRGTWQVWIPTLGWQFPVSALMYRRADVARATTVLREGRTLDAMARRELTIMARTSGWDPATDPRTQFNYDRQTDKGMVDTLATMVGRTEIDFYSGSDANFVSPLLDELIDYENRRVRSTTGQLELYYGDLTLDTTVGPWAGKGWLKVNTPRTQGLAGYLDDAGLALLDNLTLRVRNKFGSVFVSALDDKPISQSARLLVQVGTRTYLSGFSAEPQAFTLGSGASAINVVGRRILTVGELPWMVENTTGYIMLQDIGEVLSIQALDPNGMPLRTLSGTLSGQGYRIDLPSDALYLLVTLNPKDGPPVILDRDLPLAVKGEEIRTHYRAAGGTPPYTWAASGLPEGMAVSQPFTGEISGTPAQGGTFEVTITVTDSASRTASHTTTLWVLPLDDAGSDDCPSVMQTAATADLGDGFKYSALGYIYDGFAPFYYLFNTGRWWYAFACGDEVSETDGFYLYDFTEGQFGFTYSAIYPFVSIVSGPNAGSLINVNP